MCIRDRSYANSITKVIQRASSSRTRKWPASISSAPISTANGITRLLHQTNRAKRLFPDKPLAARLAAVAAATESLLGRLLADEALPGEIVRPPRLLGAMRHAVLGGGKRLRPLLLVETAALFGTARDGALLAGAALECLHCYSLVHDDL